MLQGVGIVPLHFHFPEATLMEQLIDRLIQVDKEARVLVSKAKKARVKALETVDASRKQMEIDYQNELDALIEAEQSSALKAKESAMQMIEESKQSLIDGLDALYRENAELWVDRIVSRVLEA